MLKLASSISPFPSISSVETYSKREELGKEDTDMPSSPRSRIFSSPSTSNSTLVCFLFLLFFLGSSDAQIPAPTPSSPPRTDPTEEAALNSIFSGWRISASSSSVPWNISGSGLCSGAAIDSLSTFDDSTFNPAIKCNCTIGNNSTCHITQLKARGLGVSGIIPKELGTLRYLTILNIGMNNFIGSLPVELGNLENLQQMFLDSLGLGISGQIPSSFAKLQKLQVLWTSDNNFTGTIPDFFSNLMDLTELRFQGNSFNGPIPSSFGNLTKLNYLWMGELLTPTSSLDFLAQMNSLKTLILRNSKVSGVLPANTSWTDLEHLDLSFNNLSGSLPQTLFNLPTLEYLFLGNNTLSGALPIQKSLNLNVIDLSYNELSGSFPSWVRETNLSLNLVANNFIIDSSNNSGLPSGLRCLQKSIPCNRSSPDQSSFAINCGSSQPVVILNGPSYDIDSETLGAASYYVNNEKWAVSNVGKFANVNNLMYIQNIGSRFVNTPNSELYQAARVSPSSLRYYGLGLVNGNYIITLQFGETDNWNSQGRRFFDIYIQGNLIVKDFNIYSEAGNNTLTAVEKTYTAVVENNFLEIHFFWAGKGTCCLPVTGTYGPSISAISVTRNSITSSTSATSKRTNKVLVAVVVVLVVAFCAVVVAGIFIWRKKKRQLSVSDDEELLGLTAKPDIFSYTELRSATKDFNVSYKLGEGGFGPVYKGVLPDGREIAVKKLSVASAQGKRQFVTEIATISAVQHRNLVKLYGCCYEGDRRLLVYEYLENRSLDQVLFGNSNLHLDWPARFKICLGTARGLAYLHEESSICFVHRDVKAGNILLDADLNPKVSDFGLAKLRDDTKSHISTGVAGTVGYLAPEYAMRGQLTEKADVFGFGVVALEILCGRRNTDQSLGPEKMYLLEWAWRLHEEKRDLEMIDPTLSSYNQDEVMQVIGVAFLCTQASPTRRPIMSRVVAMLVGDMEVSKVMTKPSYLMDWRYTEFSSTQVSGQSSAGTFSGMPSSTPTQTKLGIDEGR